ncbi:MAG: hypothetical protein ACKVRN_01995 [Pyrinomonadaceae bacterium]
MKEKQKTEADIAGDAEQRKQRLLYACAELDPHEEQMLAEIGASADLSERPEF